MTFVKDVSCANSRLIRGLTNIRSAASLSSVTTSNKGLEILERWDTVITQLERIHLHLFLLLGHDGEQIDPGAVLIPKRGSVISAVEEDEDLADLLHVRDQQASGSDGGTATAASGWQTRTLQTVVTNEISGASLASNQITLPAGTYEVKASAMAFRTNNHTSKLRDTTNNTDLVIGTAAFADAGADGSATDSFIEGRFTLSGSADLEIQTNVQTDSATNGYGPGGGFGVVEVFINVFIKKIS